MKTDWVLFLIPVMPAIFWFKESFGLAFIVAEFFLILLLVLVFIQRVAIKTVEELREEWNSSEARVEAQVQRARTILKRAQDLMDDAPGNSNDSRP